MRWQSVLVPERSVVAQPHDRSNRRGLRGVRYGFGDQGAAWSVGAGQALRGKPDRLTAP